MERRVMPMRKSQSESSFPPPLKIRGARGVMKLDQGFAKGKRTMPGPGRDKYEIRSAKS